MKKHRKIQKKQETELYVQVAEKPENQKENVGEALACFCIYVGWYLMVMQFCRASLAMILSGSVGAILLVMAVLVNGQKEKKFIRKIVHEILAAAVLCFLISFTIRKGWIFQGALIAGNGLLETIGRNMRAFEPDYALTISEPLQPFVTAVFYVTAGMVLAALLEFLRVSKSCIGTILVSLIPGVLLLIWQKETVLFPVLLIYAGFLCLVAFRKKEKGLAQLQTDVMLLVLFAAVTAAGFFMLRGKASSFSPDNPFSQKVQKFAEQIRYGKKTVDSLPEGQFRGLGNLKLTDEAALKVTMEHPDSLYLRGFVGSIYTEGGWKQQDADEIYDKKDLFYWLHKENVSGLQQLTALYQLENPADDDTGNMTVTTIGASRKYAYVPYELSTLPDTLENVRSFGDDRLIPEGFRPQKTISFPVHSNLIRKYPQIASAYYQDQDTEAFAEYKKCENSYNAYVYDQYLQVPDSLKQMLTKVLASDSDEKDSENVTSHISYEEANTRITGYLNENITYTEEIDPKNTDVSGENQKTDAKTGNFVTDFLMTEKKGYSVHYASAAVLMYRCFGIPARYVEGYLVTPEMAENAQDDRTIYVTGKEAHAWVEIYQDGIGWIPMEVTPPYLDKMERPDFETVSWQGAQNQGASEQTDTAEQIKDEEQTKPETRKGRKQLPVRKILIIVILLLILALILWIAYQILKYRKKWKEKNRAMYSKDASQAIRSCYAQLRCWLMYDGVRIKGGSRYQICEELSRKYSSEMADQYRKVTRLAEKAAYSSHAMEEKQAEEVRAFLMSTQKQILNEKNLFQKWKMQLKVLS